MLRLISPSPRKIKVKGVDYQYEINLNYGPYTMVRNKESVIFLIVTASYACFQHELASFGMILNHIFLLSSIQASS